MTCQAVTSTGYRCRNDRKYGHLCGTHYAMAERNITRLTTGQVNGRTIAIAERLDRYGIPADMPAGRVRAVLRDDYGIGANESHIRDAIMYRRLAAA